MKFILKSNIQKKGDQIKSIEELTHSIINSNEKYNTLLGVTGSGKTFTIANVIENVQKPTLIIAHNKTLAAQLYMEFKNFFPDNLIEYFVSYYDYYQPEAFIPSSGKYIEKDLSINEEIEKLRLHTVSSLMSKRKDIIVVSSVSCIYNLGNPKEFSINALSFKINKSYIIDNIIKELIKLSYIRNDKEFYRGIFRVKGNSIDIFPVYSDHPIKLIFNNNKLLEIIEFDINKGNYLNTYINFILYPASTCVSSQSKLDNAIKHIQIDLGLQINYFLKKGKRIEANRIKERTEYDIEMLKEMGYCKGMENYSKYFDNRLPGSRPYCLIDFFPKDYLLIIDESHATIPQINAMYGGDFSRKKNLIEYGFRLPSAMDNRPLKFSEFETLHNKVIHVSATPSEYEIQKSNGVIIEQIIRPTGLLDPIIEIIPTKNQIDHLLNEVDKIVKKKEKILITTLTKKMAEDFNKYLLNINIKSSYIHSDVDTIERIEIIKKLREGYLDVLIGVNLLREGLDIPEVSLVAIMDADKEGFLRNYKSLTQIIGRAARNINGKAILYADIITESIKKTIQQNNRNRKLQIEYNKKNNITPTALNKKILSLNLNNTITKNSITNIELGDDIKKLEIKMKKFAKNLNFKKAAQIRDYINNIKKSKDIL